MYIQSLGGYSLKKMYAIKTKKTLRREVLKTNAKLGPMQADFLSSLEGIYSVKLPHVQQ